MKRVFRVFEVINAILAGVGIFCLCNLNDNAENLMGTAVLLLVVSIVCGLLAALFEYLQRIEITLPNSACIVLYIIQMPFTHMTKRRSR